MKRLFGLLDKWIPVSIQKDESSLLYARLVIAFSIPSALMLLLVFAPITYLLNHRTTALTLIGFAPLLAATPLILWRTKKINMATRYFVLIGYVAVLMTGWRTELGIFGPPFVWLIFTSVLSGLLLDSRHYVIMFCTVLFTFPIAGWVTRNSSLLDANFDIRILAPSMALSSFLLTIFVTLLSRLYRKEREDALRLAQTRNIQNANLLQVISHDIANPLAVVTCRLDILRSKSQPSEADLQKNLAAIERAAGTIEQILRHVKEMRALEQGKRQITLEPVSLADAFQEVQFIFEDRLQKKDLRLVLDPPPSPSLHVLAEKTSIVHHVLNNVISNSIKFSQRGSVIQVGVREEKARATITIRDHGIGIPESVRPFLFDFEKKTTRPGTEGESGTGFGLPLVKNYLDRYGGQIQLESQTIEENPTDHGTAFQLTVKIAS